MPPLRHHTERVGIVLRRPESVSRNDVVAEVYGPFDRHDEVIFRARDFMGIGKELILGKDREFLKVRKGG